MPPSDQIDDAFLVQAAQDGDLAAFEAIVRRHQRSVYRVAVRMLGSSADAQDVTQDTFVRAWRGIHSFRRDSALSTWLYRIVIRRCLDLLATRRSFEPLAEAELALVVPDVADSVAQRERLRAVMQAINRLPADQRAALVLREFEGLSHRELAEVLAISVPAVKARIHRARLAMLDERAGWQ